ncbi:MAG: alpha/beta hydrolase, partial [Actinomycetota bacterium]|nr:alpha/beta hydrolase [Actinomycetota bacterium]
GAWHGDWAWAPLIPQLEAAGLSVTAVALPSAGGEGDLAADAAVVRAALAELDGPAILVGHSYGGIVISEAATTETVAHLVYVCAFLLPVGVSLLDSLNHEIPQWISVDEPTGVSRALTPETVFYGDVPQNLIDAALPRLTTQTLSSFAAPQTRAAWENVPSTYVICDEDRALPPPAQEAMSQAATSVLRLNSSHSPFLSQPEKVAEILAGITA